MKSTGEHCPDGPQMICEFGKLRLQRVCVPVCKTETENVEIYERMAERNKLADGSLPCCWSERCFSLVPPENQTRDGRGCFPRWGLSLGWGRLEGPSWPLPRWESRNRGGDWLGLRVPSAPWQPEHLGRQGKHATRRQESKRERGKMLRIGWEKEPATHL